jgi:uncharacterized membrane protein YkvA (DUF1232 family)
MEQPRSRPVVPKDHALVQQPMRRMQERAAEGQESRHLASTQHKRKAKHARRQAPAPQPKPMWPAIICLILAGLYIASPVDLIPDVPVVGVWDDIIIAVLGLRKFERDRKSNAGGGQQFRPPMGDRYTDERYDTAPRMPLPRFHGEALPPAPEPGFFGRLWKAFMYIISGGAL